MTICSSFKGLKSQCRMEICGTFKVRQRSHGSTHAWARVLQKQPGARESELWLLAALCDVVPLSPHSVGSVESEAATLEKHGPLLDFQRCTVAVR